MTMFTQTCNMGTYILVALIADMSSVVVAIFSALRVFALLGRGYSSYICSMWVLVCGFGPMVIDLHGLAITSYVRCIEDALGKHCAGVWNVPIKPTFVTSLACGKGSAYIACTGDMAEDIPPSSASFFAEYTRGQQYTPARCIYFVASLVRDVVQIASTVTLIGDIFQPKLSASVVAPISTVSATIGSIVTSRFIINLRHANNSNNPRVSRCSRFSVPHFQVPMDTTEGIIESMGGPLEFTQRPVWEEEDDCIHPDEWPISSEHVGDAELSAH
ncbi:hypothetical protein NM688_g1315 [Phlebia brevispora]|uniref:Uncharacterized protein n=1 Tax=Phlebia brevispora TaxID=194682 RepID=A0ACC1TBI8_9APHY|nr:hypothetical protein NM688_g1315 [Phlebia brevispora]